MLVNQNLSQELYEDAGYERTQRAKEYVKMGKINIIKLEYNDLDNFEITSVAHGNYDDYEVNISVRNGELDIASCECKDYEKTYGVCKHILATLIKFEQTKFWDDTSSINNMSKRKAKNEIRYREFDKILNDFYNEQLKEINSDELNLIPKEEKIKIEPKILFDKIGTNLKIEFKVGNKKMYKVKDLPDFYTRVINNEYYKYGQKLEFVHCIQNFDESSQELLGFILKYTEIMKLSNNLDKYNYYYTSSLNQPTITLGRNTIDEAFDILKKQKVDYDFNYAATKMEFIEGDPKIEFELKKVEKDDFELVPNIDVYSIRIFEGEKYTYILEENRLYRCSEKFNNSSIKLIKAFRKNYTSSVALKKEKLKDFYAIIMPQIQNNIKVSGIDEEEIELYKPKKLGTKVFLDFDKNDYLILEPKFCYAEEEFNPLNENIKIEAVRNEVEENRILNIFRKTGFMIDKQNARLILPDNEKIYNFLYQEIDFYMQKFEVMVTDNFKLKEIKKPKIGTIGVKVENNLLSIDLSKINLNAEDFEEVMNKYKLKKSFHRLKDGS